MRNTLDFRIGSRYPSARNGFDCSFEGTISNAELFWQETTDEQIYNLFSSSTSTSTSTATSSTSVDTTLTFPSYSPNIIASVPYDRQLLAADGIFTAFDRL